MKLWINFKDIFIITNHQYSMVGFLLQFLRKRGLINVVIRIAYSYISFMHHYILWICKDV